jgi:RNA polymerase sigma-70 factor (ECF subfamily)
MTNVDGEHLSEIATQWTLLARAHRHDGDEREAAFAELLPRYCRAIAQYLRRLVGDTGAMDLSQEFALRFLRGEFRHADPSRGRFRDYVKASAIYMAMAYRKKVAKHAHDRLTPVDPPAPAADDDAAFRQLWRSDVLSRTWVALEQASQSKGDLRSAVLNAKADRPEASSEQIADALSASTGQKISVDNVRQLMHRAREKFAELLRAEVAATLPGSDAAEVDQELAELGLLKYCR